MPYRNSLLLSAVLCTLLAGCGMFGGNKSADYRTQGGKVPSLEVPPDLTSPVADDRFMIPDAKSTTYSAYNRQRGAAPVTTVLPGSTVLPQVEGARIERAGEQRWLVVKGSPDKVWTVVKDFWQEGGFTLKRESPEVGVMETDWAENRSKIPQDFVRNTLGRFIDGVYDSGQRDKFRTRLETGSEPGTTEVYISHRGVEEIYTSPEKVSTGWQPRPHDAGLEAEMLTKLMVKFGYGAAVEKAAVAATGTTAGTATAASAAASAPTRASYDKTKGGTLKVNDPFDRAWRRVGLALDNTGFTVEDRDRSKGLFFVRYIDPEAEAKSGDGKGILDRLAFWRKDDPESRPQYRIHLVESAGITDVEVQTSDGKVDNSATAKRILGLLLDQLK